MQHNPLIKILLLPLSLFYGIIVMVRNKMFDLGILPVKEFNVPVISVGNITVGGTGKTPVAEYLTELLKDEFPLAVLSRGYKRKTRGFVLADEYSTAYTIGDEPCQIKNRYPDITVAVCSSRVKGVSTILNLHPETEVIILDDAYQHRYIKPGLSILLIDYNNPVTKDFLLPAGMLREPASGKKRAHIILVTKCPEKLKPIDRRIMIRELDLYPFQHLFFTTFHYKSILPVFKEYASTEQDMPDKEKTGIILLTGIANPKPLKQYTRHLSSKVNTLAFPDHHHYTHKDIGQLEEAFNKLNSEFKVIITTEKDAMRLRKIDDIPEILKKSMFYIPVSIGFINDEGKNFNQLIINYVRNFKKNNFLYKGSYIR